MTLHWWGMGRKEVRASCRLRPGRREAEEALCRVGSGTGGMRGHLSWPALHPHGPGAGQAVGTLGAQREPTSPGAPARLLPEPRRWGSGHGVTGVRFSYLCILSFLICKMGGFLVFVKVLSTWPDVIKMPP